MPRSSFCSNIFDLTHPSFFFCVFVLTSCPLVSVFCVDGFVLNMPLFSVCAFFKNIFVPVSPYQDLEKATVLQECRVFSDSNVVTTHPRRCGLLITKLLYILTQGETLSSSETTEVCLKAYLLVVPFVAVLSQFESIYVADFF